MLDKLNGIYLGGSQVDNIIHNITDTITR